MRVHDNRIHDNNLANFAPRGNIVGSVPAGTGSFVMANHDVAIYGNTFANNGTAQLAVVSYFTASIPIKDSNYYPYPARVSIHDNTFSGGGAAADTNTELGLLLLTGQTDFPDHRVPDVLYDGVTDPKITSPTETPMQICIQQPGSHIANLHLDQLNEGGSNLSRIMTVDPAGFDCALPPVAGITLPASEGGAP